MEKFLKIRSAQEKYAKLMHPLSSKAAGNDPAGVMWPHDQFTYRRIQEGSIVAVTAPARMPTKTTKRTQSPQSRANKLSDVI